MVHAGTTPTSLSVNGGSTLLDALDATKTYVFVGTAGDVGAVETPAQADGRYALYLNQGALLSVNRTWTANALGVTFTAWVRLGSLQNFHTVAGFQPTNGAAESGFWFGTHSGVPKCCFNINNFVNNDNSGMVALATNTWYHLACSVVSGGVKQFYINGVPSGTTTSNETINTNQYGGHQLAVGWYSPTSLNPSKIDDTRKNNIKVYTRPLTAAEIAIIYGMEM